MGHWRDQVRMIVVVGARPNFVKIGPLMPALREVGIQAPIAHTGQHYDASMSQAFFSDLNLPEPDWHLGVGSGTHAVQTGRAMMAIEELLIEQSPDALLVIGDVNSTLAGALAAAKLHVPVVHLEAGVRSGDMTMPEEVNRLVTDQLASMHLTPTADAGAGLISEGVDSSRIRFVGNIMAESVLKYLPKVKNRHVARAEGLDGQFALATIHRPENADRPENLRQIATAFSAFDGPVVFPVHPRTRPVLEAAGIVDGRDGVRLLNPVGYIDMLSLIDSAALCVTDSGGLQVEACVLGTPCITVRRNTEWTQTIDVGANRLVSASGPDIVQAMQLTLERGAGWNRPERWDGEVSVRIAQEIAGGISPL